MYNERDWQAINKWSIKCQDINKACPLSDEQYVQRQDKSRTFSNTFIHVQSEDYES